MPRGGRVGASETEGFSFTNSSTAFFHMPRSTPIMKTLSHNQVKVKLKQTRQRAPPIAHRTLFPSPLPLSRVLSLKSHCPPFAPRAFSRPPHLILITSLLGGQGRNHHSRLHRRIDRLREALARSRSHEWHSPGFKLTFSDAGFFRLLFATPPCLSSPLGGPVLPLTTSPSSCLSQGSLSFAIQPVSMATRSWAGSYCYC